jgi:hypothetical protein
MATWTAQYINDLPDSAFACIDSNGRHYPHHDSTGKLDLPHLRAALSRVGDLANAQCGKSHLEAHASASLGKADMAPIKATLLDDDHLRLLAIPFSGPFPSDTNPRGADRVGQWFDERTNIHPRLFEARPVDWHHGGDPLGVMGRTVIGKAILDDEPEEDGWWVDFWVKQGEKRLSLIKRVAERQPIFGSSEALWMKATDDGHITDWPYWRQTLSTSPENTHSILRPAKAVLADFASVGIEVDASIKAFIRDLDALGVDLRSTSLGEDAAKAGRVLATRNESRLRDARGVLAQSVSDPRKWKQALAMLDDVLSELERYTTTPTPE